MNDETFFVNNDLKIATEMLDETYYPINEPMSKIREHIKLQFNETFQDGQLKTKVSFLHSQCLKSLNVLKMKILN